MNSSIESLRDRIARLSEDKKIALGKRLGMLTRHTGAKSLAAFVVLDNAIDEEAKVMQHLHDHARSRLPKNLQPSSYYVVDHIPTLPNGKIDRNSLVELAPDLRQSTEDGVVDTADRVATEPESVLIRIWQEVLGVNPVLRSDNFFELGGDSIQSIKITSQARQAGIKIAPGDLLEFPTIAELAERVQLVEVPHASKKSRSSRAPLTPIQQWFFELAEGDPSHWNQAVAVDIDRSLDDDVVRQAILCLLEHHDALRTQFKKTTNGSWIQQIIDLDDVPFRVIDCPVDSESDQEESLISILDEINAAIRPDEGSVISFALLDRGIASKRTLYIAAHHLVVDAYSWTVLLRDLDTLLKQSSEGAEQVLANTSASILDWALALEKYSQSEGSTNELEYWKYHSSQTKTLPVDFEHDVESTEADIDVVESVIDSGVSAQLSLGLPPPYVGKAEELVLTAFLSAMHSWIGGKEIVIGLESHGRDASSPVADLSRTVGWVTAYYPQRFRFSGTNSLPTLLRETKEALNSVPNGGVGYGVLRYLSDEANELPNSHPEILFNYLGAMADYSTNLMMLHESTLSLSSSRSGSFRRGPGLEVNCFVKGERLHIEWRYSRRRYRKETINAIAAEMVGSLSRLVNHLLNDKSHLYSPSDFPDVQLNQDQIDKLLRSVSGQDSDTAQGI